MSTPQTLPPKAVLRVLQGLLLGTSCSLAILIEDRRRRINAVQAVLENGRKLKALPQYREGGTERAIARALAACNIDQETANTLRESLVPDPSLFDRVLSSHSDATTLPPSPPPVRQLESNLPPPHNSTPYSYETAPHLSAGTEPTSYPVPVYRYDRMTFAKYFPGMERLSERHRKAPLSRAIRGAVDRPGRHEMATREMVHVVATVTGLLSTPDEREWNQGWDIALQTLSKPVTRQILETALLENAIQLARALEESGRLSEAGQLMRLVMRSDLTVVSPSKPNYVERLVVAHIDSLCSTPTSNQEEHARAVDRAVHFYVAAFNHQPPSDMDSALSIGLRLVPLVIDIGLCGLASKLVASCANTDPRFWELQNLYLASLLQRGALLDAIDHFLKYYSQYPESLPHNEQVQSVVDAVVQLEGLRSGAIIEFLIGTPWARGLKCSWVSKLLVCHWKHAGDYAKTKSYFGSLVQHCRAVHSAVPLRSMIQIAFAAGEADDAQAMLREYEKVSRPVLDSIPVLGTLALNHAANGEWAAVKNKFSRMVDEARASETDHPRVHTIIARALPPVIKEYAKSHTLEETVNYSKFFIGDLKVQVDKYIVTLLAKQYVMKHDVRGLVDWLGFCASRGFANDAAFLTAILSSCRSWGYGVTKTFRLARRMHKLNPGFDRRAYMNIIRDAAAESKALKVKKLRLAVEPVEMGNERAVCRAMVAAIRRGMPQTAMEIYGDIQSAEDVDRSGSCLREAIRASILHRNGDSSGALALLREAQQRGQNIAPSLMPILAAHMDMLPPLVDPVEEFLKIVQNLKDQENIMLPTAAFTLGSYRFLKSGRYQDAIRFCRVAMDMDGSPGVATTKHHFCILMEAYAMTGQTKALQSLFISAKSQPYKTEASCLRTVRRVRHKLLNMATRDGHYDAEYRGLIQLMGSMIRILRAERAGVVGRAGVAEEQALQIVTEAARLVAGQPHEQSRPQRQRRKTIESSGAELGQSKMIHPVSTTTIEAEEEEMEGLIRSGTNRIYITPKAAVVPDEETVEELNRPGTKQRRTHGGLLLGRRDGGSDFDSDSFRDDSSAFSGSALETTTPLHKQVIAMRMTDAKHVVGQTKTMSARLRTARVTHQDTMMEPQNLAKPVAAADGSM